MTLQGPRLVDSATATAFTDDLLARPEHVREGIDNAMDRLAELPVGNWRPARDALMSTCEEQAKALGEVYVRGVLACGLVLGEVIGHHIFYTPPEPMKPYGDVGVGVLLRANDTLVAARVVFAGLDDMPWFDGFHDGHAEVLMHLTEMTTKATGDRLKAARENQ